jgi:phosphohistidine phosphatase
MNLYFMRHGIAADRADGGAGSGDRERPLTPKGVKRMHRAANGLVTLSLSFDRILTSPLERARQTANIVAQTLHLEKQLAEIEQLCPDQLVKDLISGLVAYSGAKNILLVGHEPLLSSTVSYLLSGKAGAEIQFKKGGLCCLLVDGMPPQKSAVLHWALTPKQLRLLAR